MLYKKIFFQADMMVMFNKRRVKLEADVSSRATREHWPIYIISLADHAARRANLLKQLAEVRLQATVFNAIDGRYGLSPEYESQIDRNGTLRNLGRAMSDAEYACALSHMAVYRHLINKNLPGAIILEDDALITTAFLRFVQNEDYLKVALALLDYANAYVWKLPQTVFECGSIGYRVAANPDLTTGYSISQKAAKFFLANAVPLRSTADWPCRIVSLKAVALNPRLVRSQALESSIAGERFALKIDAKRQLTWRAYFRMASFQRWLIKRLTIKLDDCRD